MKLQGGTKARSNGPVLTALWIAEGAVIVTLVVSLGATSAGLWRFKSQRALSAPATLLRRNSTIRTHGEPRDHNESLKIRRQGQPTPVGEDTMYAMFAARR